MLTGKDRITAMQQNYLGLVERNNDIYILTDIGEYYIHLSAGNKSNFICKLLLQFPIVNKIFLEITSDRDKKISKQDIILLLKKRSGLTGSTLERRARTIITWFRWMRKYLGMVEVDSKGSIMMNRIVK
ncbi:MAG: AAA-associated domain-containing protein [Nitrososphaeraceae archaeon]